MELTVIISTYNSPEWLEKVLWGYQYQSFRNFELLVADDGSGKRTADLIERMKQKVFYPLQHIWQEDKGFCKCAILNKSIKATNADYIVFSDGDCIPRADFLKAHAKEKRPGYFLSGGYFKLPMEISKAITLKDIEEQKCFDISRLYRLGLKRSFKNNKLTAKGIKQKLLNNFTTTKATWNGHNSSGWKKDILAVNGFDERMHYGGEDREMGERMMNNRIVGKQIRYSAICLHLDHERGYVNEEDLKINQEIRKTTKKQKLKWSDFGVVK